jgi:hypothetical protein
MNSDYSSESSGKLQKNEEGRCLMGYAKRAWEEEQMRRYHTSDDAVCSQCFHDPAIKGHIEDNLNATVCSVCGRESEEPIAAPADKLMEFLLEKVDEHYENADGNAPWDSEDGRFTVPTYTISDLIFHEFYDISEFNTLEWLYAHLKDDISYCQRDWQVMTPGEALESGWEQFSYAVKHETRFLFFSSAHTDEDEHEPFLVRPEQMLQELGDVIRSCELIHSVPVGTRLFRARGHAAGVSYTDPVDLGPPPQKLARNAGRMNAPGIVVFYGAYQSDAALVEATGDHEHFSMAEFELLKELNVVDLTDIPPVPSIFEGGPRESIKFLRRFATDVSQPFEPDKEIHIEYTPTQVVSEYLRHRLKDANGEAVHGVLYRSAKDEAGINLALFIESEQVEGVITDHWKKRDAVMRLIDTTEVARAGS